MTATLRVGDLITVARFRPVIRLGDLRRPDLAAELGAAFVLTEDVEHALRTVFADITAGRGRGYFLEGHYGSGKSHLLGVLHGILEGTFAASDVGSAAAPGSNRLGGIPERLPLPVSISLVEHAGTEALEGIVRRRFALAAGCVPPPGSRREVFDFLAGAALRRRGGGVAFFLDELTEFLRSKPDARAFAEDVRFLQFLGEWAQGAPAWVILSVQEAVERTGDLPAPVFGAVRDRYPVRFRLGTGHVRELIARRLIQRLPEAEEGLAAVAAGLRRTFGEFAPPAAGLLSLYPVHPRTVELLDRLRPLVSERRGVLDFVAVRLAGDAARRIPAWLDQPADRLLGPDAILDHFRDRVRERPETAPLITVVLEHFECELPRLFPDAETAAAALRLGKVLIAGALCPTPQGFTAAELTGSLLHRLTDLDPALNLEFISSVADRMAAHGAYVRAQGGGEPAFGRQPAAASAPSVRRYFCDLRADLGPALRGRLQFWRDALQPGDGRIFRALLPWCDDPCLPLQRLAAAPRGGPWDVAWRRTARQAAVWLTDLAALAVEDLREAVRALEVAEPDALVLVAAGVPGDPAPLRRLWTERLAPTAVAMHPDAPVLCWLPRPPGAEEGAVLRNAAARAMLAEELAADASATGRRLLRQLRLEEGEWHARAARLHRDLYLEGELHDVRGNVARPADLGPLPFSALLERMLEEPFRRRFPLLPDLPARPEALPPAAATSVLGRFVRSGAAEGDSEVAQLAARALLPLGLCQRDARGLRLADDAGSGPHAAQVTAAVAGRTPAGPVPVDLVYLRLRKGPSGLTKPLFSLLCLVLLRTGAVSAVRAGRRLPPERLDPERLWQVEGLCAGALVPPDLRPAVRTLPFVSAAARDRPWTHALQRELWDAACAWRRRWGERLPALRAEAARVRDFPALRDVLRPERLEDLDRLERLLAAVALSLPPHEGLGRLLAAVASDPAAAAAAQRAEALDVFLRDRLDTYVQTVAYLGAEEFVPPAELAAAVSGLRAQLADPETVFGPEFGRVQADFGALRAAYADAYAAAHAAAVGTEAFSAHAAIGGGAARRLAQLVGGPAVEALEAALASALAGRCAVAPGALGDRLLRWPSCRCGYRFGHPPAAVQGDELRIQAAAAAAGALRALQAPECARRLRAAGGAAAGELLDLPAEGDAVADRALALIAVIGEATVRSALGPGPVPVDRELSVLGEVLSGRDWAGTELLAAVRAWVGDAGPGVRLRVVSGARNRGRAAARAAEAVGALRMAVGRPPANHLVWEALWSGAAGGWACRVEAAADEVRDGWDRRADPAVPHLSGWRREAGECASRLERMFAADLRRWSADGFRREGLAPVGRALDACAGRGAGATFAFCVDALRADLLEAVLDLAASALPRLRPVSTGMVWAVSPTLTATQFEAWAAAGWSVEIVHIDGGAAEAVAEGGRAALGRVAWVPGRRCVCKWDFLDARLHASDDDFGMVAAEFRLRAHRLLLPVLAALESGDRAVLFGDHGFRIRNAEDGTWRYEHGGDSPDEVLVPFCVLEAG